MNSYILLGSQKKREQYLEDFCKEHTISAFDQAHITTEGSIGIEIVRKVQETLFLKPYQGKEKVLIVENAENLTPEAQNALLKILEEPPVFVFIFLSASKNNFLPTIISRCQIITLENEKKEASVDDEKILQEQMQILEKGSVNEKLALAEKIAADKENIEKWFEQIIVSLRKNLLEERDKQTPIILMQLQEAHKTFSTTNVSPRNILEHYFLELSSRT